MKTTKNFIDDLMDDPIGLGKEFIDFVADTLIEQLIDLSQNDNKLTRNIANYFLGAKNLPARIGPLILDLGGDGLVDAHDARFAALRVWRDLNGDGNQPGR